MVFYPSANVIRAPLAGLKKWISGAGGGLSPKNHIIFGGTKTYISQNLA